MDFPLFWRKFSESQRALGLKIFIKKVKNYFFLKTWFLGISEENNDFWIFHFFDENFQSQIPENEFFSQIFNDRRKSGTVNFRQIIFFWKHDLSVIYGRFRKKNDFWIFHFFDKFSVPDSRKWVFSQIFNNRRKSAKGYNDLFCQRI